MASSTTVADVLAKRILEAGSKTLFALAGATFAPLLMAFQDGGGKVIGGRHEAGTVGAADGYARRTGKIGFACIIAEQALANALTAILTASESETPLVVIATRYPDSWIEPAAKHLVDRHDFTSTLLKFSRTVPSPERVGEYFLAACKAAMEDTPGPALLIIPMDMMGKPVPEPQGAFPRPITLPVAEISQIESSVSAISEARQPIVVVDEGAVWGDSAEGLNALAALGIPVLGNGLGRGLVAEKEPTGYPWPYAQRAAANADLVIVVGAKMTMWFGYGRAPRFNETARFIHIDSNAQAIGRNFPVEIPIIAHPGRTVKAIASRLQETGYHHDPQWLADALAERKERVASFVGQGDAGIHQIEIGAALEEALPEDRIVVCDGADILNFTFGRLRVHRPRSYADHLPYGAMGMGFPLAIGFAAGEAELAAEQGVPPAPTAYITGDGSVGFFLAELDTMRRAGLFLIAVVSNDSKWGTEYHGQNLMYGRTANTELGLTDYAAVASAFGCLGSVVTDRPGLASSIQAALAHRGPSLLDVRIDPMGGAIRKKDPVLGMIIFEEVAKKHSP
ncbi:thiamine diphosphate-binding protein [Thozetella sp. PMI_491]|nr:thiamine diphosphate-binding protein [Thozetella sp. PMI_491]